MHELDRSYSSGTPAPRTRRALPSRFLDRAVRGHGTLDLVDAAMGLLGRHALRRAPEILAPGWLCKTQEGELALYYGGVAPADLELQCPRPGHRRTDREGRRRARAGALHRTSRRAVHVLCGYALLRGPGDGDGPVAGVDRTGARARPRRLRRHASTPPAAAPPAPPPPTPPPRHRRPQARPRRSPEPSGGSSRPRHLLGDRQRDVERLESVFTAHGRRAGAAARPRGMPRFPP